MNFHQRQCMFLHSDMGLAYTVWLKQVTYANFIVQLNNHFYFFIYHRAHVHGGATTNDLSQK